VDGAERIVRILLKEKHFDRFCSFARLIFVMVFFVTLPVIAQAEERIRIIVTREQDAQNWPVEEAFFTIHPEAEIEYMLYSEEPLNARLISHTSDADLVILPYNIMIALEEKGYLEYLDVAADIHSYPEQLLDLSRLLTRDGRVFALPVSLYQEYWLWDQEVGDALGMEYQEVTSWSWKDYNTLASSFPCDTDQDGISDTYLIYGQTVAAFPTLQNVNLGMLFQYISSHREFQTFLQEHLQLFTQIVTDDALLDMNVTRQVTPKVLLHRTSLDNPITFMAPDALKNNNYLLFLPPPSLPGEEEMATGYLWACGVLHDSASKELAGDFIRAMVSETALQFTSKTRYDQIISVRKPSLEYTDSLSQYGPEFVSVEGFPVYTVRPGRKFLTSAFPYSEEAFRKSQSFRSRLIVNTAPYGRDFYDAVYVILQEWLDKQISDDTLCEEMNYLLNLAGGA